MARQYKRFYIPAYGSFFYLNDDSKRIQFRGVRKITLLRDLYRGVKFLNEQAYHTGWGSTRASLRFFKYLQKHINVTKAYRAKLTLSQKHWYTLKVWTLDGYVMQFKGVSGGYTGEGTRGCYDILKACGFSERQCQQAFREEQFEVRKVLKASDIIEHVFFGHVRRKF